MASDERSTSTKERENFKILCLHGIGGNGDVPSLRYQLGDKYEFDFVDGAHPWPAAPGITQAFGVQVCYSYYYDGTAASALAAVDDLATYVVDNGPFDAVLGFSMGAALAATLLLQPDERYAAARQMIPSAALSLCLRQGKMGFLKAADQVRKEDRVAIPTVHAWSPQDTDQPGQSQQLIKIDRKDPCLPCTHLVIEHRGRHGMSHCPVDVSNE
ncbi:hypothetical protein QBC46DRAFT_366281 [Diplogelasinospora grovesii]|uniref:Serine hydrolase domain-containing protein n=1 Tax=Diplogelasinospora grovesii TaxID=303347 RepID=A0AAN6N1E4_9PEZI|nr:hypothetical protein QBC46DRAFT_366281 [Diplogelasinospora grovesii]